VYKNSFVNVLNKLVIGKQTILKATIKFTTVNSELNKTIDDRRLRPGCTI